MLKLLIAPLFAVLLSLLGGCVSSQPSPFVVDVAITTATTYYIDQASDKLETARSVRRVATTALELAENRDLTVSEIRELIVEEIVWDSLEVHQQVLARSLINTIAMRLEEKVESGELTETDTVDKYHLLSVVIAATHYYEEDES